MLEALEILVHKGQIVLEPCHISKLIEKGFAHHLIRASNGKWNYNNWLKVYINDLQK